ncbi:MAG: hypothetical protein ACWA5K_01210 [bacterium]
MANLSTLKQRPLTLAALGWGAFLVVYLGVFIATLMGFEITPSFIALSPLGILGAGCWIVSCRQAATKIRGDGTFQSMLALTISLCSLLALGAIIWLLINGF